MSISSSLSTFKRLNGDDRKLAQAGVRRGWYLYHHYLGRFRTRMGMKSLERLGQFTIHNKNLLVHFKPEQLSTLFNIFGLHEYDLTTLLPEKPKTILDLGANSGMAALYFQAHYPQAAIACVEPDPRNIDMLGKTLKSNGLENSIRVIPAAIAAQAGRLKLRTGTHSTCSALETSPMHDLQGFVEVDVTTVPDVLKQLGWESIDLLKIDIEGTEDELLSTHNDWLKHVKAIVLEIHPNTTPEKIQSYLSPFGFSLTPLQRSVEPVYFAIRK